MDLEDLIAELISDGYSPKEAAKVAAATLRASERKDSVVKTNTDITFPASPQSDGRRTVNYGNETPQEAKQRWIEQEMDDPQGVYSGGMSGGGIFGEGSISTDTYDPEAVHRTLRMREGVASNRVQLEMLRTMREMQESMRNETNRLPPRESSFRRLLGKKKR